MAVENCGTYDVVIVNDKIQLFRTIDELLSAVKADNEYISKLENKLGNSAKLLYSAFKNNNYKEDDIKEACVGLDFNEECKLDVQYDDKEHIYCIYDTDGELVAKMHYIIDELEDFRRIYSKYMLINNTSEVNENIIHKYIPSHNLNELMADGEQFCTSWNHKVLKGEDIQVYFNILKRPEITQEEFYSSQIEDNDKLYTYMELSNKFDNKSLAEKRRIEVDIIFDKIKAIAEN